MTLAECVQSIRFRSGTWKVQAVLAGSPHELLELTFDSDDESEGVRLPAIRLTADKFQATVSNALVRAGARHPGLRDEDLAELHAQSRRHRHIELFVDINALKQGLVGQVAQSLGDRVARIVVSSSTIDVLHEYQSFARRHHDGSPRVVVGWELARAMRLLSEFKPPVHVHQLAPGAARYFRRSRAEGLNDGGEAGAGEEHEERTYVAEDRQMVAALWNYMSTGSPRMPLFLVTSDLALAHVCAAERVPFVFAKAPREFSPFVPEVLWFDPYALAFRTCLAQIVLWELSVVFGRVNVVGPSSLDSFTLHFEPRDHLPGAAEQLAKHTIVTEEATETAVSKAKSGLPSDRKLKLSLASVVEVLPTHAGQKVPVSQFRAKDPDATRQLWQIGEATDLFRQDGGKIVAGAALESLLAALRASDYIAVNDIFRKVAGYDRVLKEAKESGLFKSSKSSGAATGWAIVLGAAYKLPGSTRFGLSDVAEDQFERAVVRTHAELSGGARAVPLYRVLDRVCTELLISPVRFEALLNQCLGQRGLRNFEAQRATSMGKIPSHPVLALPSTSASSSYLRKLNPGEGLVVGGKLVASLVRRGGSS